MERKGERVGGVNENGSVFGWREWRDGGDHAGQRIIEENSKREREKRLSERRVLGVEGRTECEKCGERGAPQLYIENREICRKNLQRCLSLQVTRKNTLNLSWKMQMPPQCENEHVFVNKRRM